MHHFILHFQHFAIKCWCHKHAKLAQIMDCYSQSIIIVTFVFCCSQQQQWASLLSSWLFFFECQQKLKHRMNVHFSETKQLVNDNASSDSFAKHFAGHLMRMRELPEEMQQMWLKLKLCGKVSLFPVSKPSKNWIEICVREKESKSTKWWKKTKKMMLISHSTLWMKCTGPVDTIPSFIGTDPFLRKVLMTRSCRKSQMTRKIPDSDRWKMIVFLCVMNKIVISN